MNIMESLLIGGDGSGHMLHLYDSKLNKYSVQVPFISAARKEEKIIYVTAEENLLKEELELENLDLDLVIYRPEEMGKICLHDKGRVIVDVSSFDDTSEIIEKVEEERRVITTDAFGYLIHLLKLGSVNKEIFEKVIVLSIQLNGFLKRKITRDMVDNIVNYIIFSGIEDVSVRDLLDLFFIQENEINFDEEIN